MPAAANIPDARRCCAGTVGEAAVGGGRVGSGPGRPPLVGGRCAVMRPPAGAPGAGAAAAAACMRSSRVISELNLAASSCSPNSCNGSSALHAVRHRSGLHHAGQRTTPCQRPMQVVTPHVHPKPKPTACSLPG